MADITTNLYEFNKVNMLQIPPLEEAACERQLLKAAESMLLWEYAMLLSNERKDYTVFKIDNANMYEIEQELTSTLFNRGTIIDLYIVDNNAWEIWIKDKNENGEDEAYIYYLFDYSFGVVDCKAGGTNG
ncbi:MAG: hypothetical protein J6T34_03540 [Bacilli bacterium]|nr:hypothetical protein [Bacilli bacterium]